MRSALILTGLFALAFQPSAAVTPGEAVESAFSVPPVDMDAVLQESSADPGKVLGGVGSASTEGLERQTDLYQNGFGVLYDPAVGEVVRCRTQTDTTCRAVQILDRGFPERPPVPDDILLGRDETVGGAGLGDTGIDNGTGGCRPVTVTTPPVETTETCRSGGWFEDVYCRTGVIEQGRVTAKYFSCARSDAREENLTCRSTMAPGSITEYTERCFFGQEASVPGGTIVETTAASASALFPAVCTAPQGSVETVTCQEILTVKESLGCTAGESVSAVLQGGIDLTSDACPLGDTITVTHTCGQGKRVGVSLNGYPSVRLSPRQTSRLYTNSQNGSCVAVYEYRSISCSGDACVAEMRGQVRYGSTPTGYVTVRLTFADESVTQTEEIWEDYCRDLRGETAP